SAEWYEQVLAQLPIGVYTCEAPSGVISYYNAEAAVLWGREPLLNHTDERFCGAFRRWLPDGREMSRESTPMAVALITGQQFRNKEVVVERPDGSRATMVVNIDPIRDEKGTILGAMNAFHDISALRAAEESLRKSEARMEVLFNANCAL